MNYSSMDTSPSTPATFENFSHLPLELRLKIWSYIIHQPRLVKLIASQRHWRNPYSQAGWTTHDTPIPISLHICHESREECLKYYQPAFASPFCDGKVYINFSIDTIRFGNGLAFFSIQDVGRWTEPSCYLLDVFLGGGPHGADDYEKIEEMVLDVSETLYARRNFCWDEVRLFEGLKRLTLLVWEPDYAHGQIMGKYKETLGRVQVAHPEWDVPKVMVISMESGTNWGLLEPLPVIAARE